jgi:hypothetical protein
MYWYSFFLFVLVYFDSIRYVLVQFFSFCPCIFRFHCTNKYLLESKYTRTKRKKLYQYISNGIEIYKDKKKETVPINIYWNRNIQGQKERNCTNTYLMESKYIRTKNISIPLDMYWYSFFLFVLVYFDSIRYLLVQFLSCCPCIFRFH